MPRSKPPIMTQMAELAEWSPQAACRGEEPRKFDTEQGGGQTLITLDTEEAMDICAVCPVMLSCLHYAIKYGETEGIWGGLTPEDRNEYSAREALVA